MSPQPTLKGWYINPFTNTINEVVVDYNDQLKGIYKLLDCDMIETVTNKNYVVICDEEGRFKTKTCCFYFDRVEYVSPIFVVSVDNEGWFADAVIMDQEIRELTQF